MQNRSAIVDAVGIGYANLMDLHTHTKATNITTTLIVGQKSNWDKRLSIVTESSPTMTITILLSPSYSRICS